MKTGWTPGTVRIRLQRRPAHHPGHLILFVLGLDRGRPGARGPALRRLRQPAVRGEERPEAAVVDPERREPLADERGPPPGAVRGPRRREPVAVAPGADRAGQGD